MIPKIVDGQIAKWKKEVCLLDQVWVKDPEGKKDIRALLDRARRQDRREHQVRRFVRYELGEGLEKKTRRLRRRGDEAGGPGLDAIGDDATVAKGKGKIGRGSGAVARTASNGAASRRGRASCRSRPA